MSAYSTFSQTPAYTSRFATHKEVAAEEALMFDELKRTLLLLDVVVKTNAKEKTPRILRNLSKLRKTLSVAQLTTAVTQVLPATNVSKPLLLALLDKLASHVTVVTPASGDSDVDMTDASTTNPADASASTIVLPSLDVIEVEVFLFLLVIAALVKFHQLKDAHAAVTTALACTAQVNKRTLDAFQAKLFVLFASICEISANKSVDNSEIVDNFESVDNLRATLLAAHRTACLRFDEIGQATLVNLILRSFVREHLFDQAYKFVTKTTFPEAASNNQFVRFLYYVGKVQAVQLEYSDAFTKLMQSIRKAPQNTAIGFRRTVYKLAVIVQLLMGDVPERSIFNQDDLRVALAPYLQLTNAVRVGNLEEFNAVLTQHAALFQADETYSLILRLRHNVIKTGLRKISASYSKIRFSDICAKLALESPQTAEFVCAKAIRDGVIDATIDHDSGWLESNDSANVYTTNDPQGAFQKRITFCLDVHNDAVKGMRYPPDAYKKDLESAEERLEREKQEEELAKEIEDEMDDEGL